MGISKHHRIGLQCEDSIDYIVASLAILSLSAVVVPVSPKQKPNEIEEIITTIGIDYLVVEILPRPRINNRSPNIHHLISRAFSIVKPAVLRPPPTGYYRTNAAFIRFSSGTTGTSKGVVLSHEAIVERIEAANQGLEITSDDVVLWVLSMSFHFVVTILLFLRRGATIVLCGQRYPTSLIEGVTVHKGTFIYASPFYYSLLVHSDELPGNALEKVRLAVSTTVKLPDNIAEAFHRKFGFELAEAYGIIEIGLPFIRASDRKSKRGSVGKPLPGFEVRIDNPDAKGIGEINIKGAGMLDAYYSPWQGRNDILNDGWFKTGDLGVIDEDGYLFIVGRNKDVINFGGLKIFAPEIEAVLNQHPKIMESLVYGVPHREYGQLPMAKIVVKETGQNIDPNELRQHCHQHLAQYKVPKSFEFVRELPKTPSGKIKR